MRLAGAAEVERQDYGSRYGQVAIENLTPRDEHHRLALTDHHVLLPSIGPAAEDVNSHRVREACLVRARAAPQRMQLTRRQARFLQQLPARRLFGCLAWLDMATGQAPLVRRSQGLIVAMLHEYRFRGIDEEHQRNFIGRHGEILPGC